MISFGKSSSWDVAQATAVKRVIAFQIAQEMKRRKLTKSEMASRMKTSPAALERLLDPANRSVTISTLERTVDALGCRYSSRPRSSNERGERF